MFDSPTLVTVSALDVLGLPDVLSVDLSCDQLLLCDGDSGDDDDGQGDRVDGGVNGVDVSQHEAGECGEVFELHLGLWKVGETKKVEVYVSPICDLG